MKLLIIIIISNYVLILKMFFLPLFCSPGPEVFLFLTKSLDPLPSPSFRFMALLLLNCPRLVLYFESLTFFEKSLLVFLFSFPCFENAVLSCFPCSSFHFFALNFFFPWSSWAFLFCPGELSPLTSLENFLGLTFNLISSPFPLNVFLKLFEPLKNKCANFINNKHMILSIMCQTWMAYSL